MFMSFYYITRRFVLIFIFILLSFKDMKPLSICCCCLCDEKDKFAKVKKFLQKYNIEFSDEGINKSYHLAKRKGLKNCIELKITFRWKTKIYEEGDKKCGVVSFYYNFKKNRLILYTKKYLLNKEEVINEFKGTDCWKQHRDIKKKFFKKDRNNKATKNYIRAAYYIFKSDINFIHSILNKDDRCYFYNEEKKDYIDKGTLITPVGVDGCKCNIFYKKDNAINPEQTIEEINNNMATIDDLLKDVNDKNSSEFRINNNLKLVTEK